MERTYKASGIFGLAKQKELKKQAERCHRQLFEKKTAAEATFFAEKARG